MTLDITMYSKSSQLNGAPLMLAADAPIRSTTSYAAAATIPAYGNGANRILVKFYANGSAFTITWTKGGGTKTEAFASGEIAWRDVLSDETWTVS